jgi:hypothetical protein
VNPVPNFVDQPDEVVPRSAASGQYVCCHERA